MSLSNTIYHLTLVGEHLGNRTQNGFYFTDKPGNLEDDTVTSLTDLMNDFNEWVTPNFALFCSSSWHGVGLIGQVLSPNPHWMLESGYATLAGGQDAESLPADCAAVVALDTGLSGRSFRGRIYVPGIAKSLTDGDYLSAGGFAQLAVFADSLAGRFAFFGSSLNHLHSVYSRKIGDVRDPGPPVVINQTPAGIIPIERVHPRRLVCSMRRRRPDHGI